MILFTYDSCFNLLFFLRIYVNFLTDILKYMYAQVMCIVVVALGQDTTSIFMPPKRLS